MQRREQDGIVTVLVLLDENQFPLLKQGEPPVLKYSHDKNVFQFAHEALRQGHRVYMTPLQAPHQTRPNIEVLSAYPVWRSGRTVETAEVDPDIVVSVFTDALGVRGVFPRAKIVGIIPALHWIEDPGLFNATYLYNLITAARYHIDFFVTQNERMKQILFFMMYLLARFPYEDRILVAPQGIVGEVRKNVPERSKLRFELGLKDDDVAIINSGGIWKWTDFNTFFEAYCEFTQERPDHRFKLFIMGISQENNLSHKEYTDQFRVLLEHHRSKLGDKLVLFEDWQEAGTLVQAYTSMADIGLNVSQDTLEAWQSYRMRFLDYLYFGIPAINTRGDELSVKHPNVLFLAEPGKKESYKAILREISETPEVLRQKSKAMKELAERYDSQATYGRLIQQLLMLPRRTSGDYTDWDSCIIDHARWTQDATSMGPSQLPLAIRKKPWWYPKGLKKYQAKRRQLREWRRHVSRSLTDLAYMDQEIIRKLGDTPRDSVEETSSSDVVAMLKSIVRKEDAITNSLKEIRAHFRMDETHVADTEKPSEQRAQE